MVDFKLFIFALRTNIVFFGMLAMWLFAVGIMLAGQGSLSGFMFWGGVAVATAVVLALSIRGVKQAKKWAWCLAALAGVGNMLAGVRSISLLSSQLSSNSLSRKIGAAGFVVYFLFVGAIILIGVVKFRKRPPEGSEPVAEDSDQNNSADSASEETDRGSE